ncbi:MFS transporter [Nocardioides pantholopis]|uniref:MFS transporter n=1 Tax=Nocardioides pantholopis TaxID=2483798 RepID=UPI001F14B8A7|nr:MFS transporter [Nocardioides pantholopis]
MRRSAPLVLLGILLLALNLRPAAVSVGPVLSEVRDALSMSAASAGLLTSLPVLAFACFGALAPLLARAVGVHRVTLAAVVAVAVGLAGRAAVSQELPFLLLSLVALAGMAVANVLLPSLVKLHFPDRIGRVTALYTTVLAIGLTCALVLTVPVADAVGSWRAGLGVWAGLAVIAAVPWLGLVAHDRNLDRTGTRIRFTAVARTPVGRAMAVFFGLQSLQAYVVFGWFATLWRDHGYSAGTAGLLVGLVAATSIPFSLWLPALLARTPHQRRIMWAVMLCYPLGYAFLLLAPHGLAVPAALLVGVGSTAFPIVLTLIGLRSRTPEGTAALSGFTQATGYLIAGVGPFGIGLLHDVTHGWTAPLVVLIVLIVPQLLLGDYLSRPAYVEDQLPTDSVPS